MIRIFVLKKSFYFDKKNYDVKIVLFFSITMVSCIVIRIVIISCFSVIFRSHCSFSTSQNNLCSISRCSINQLPSNFMNILPFSKVIMQQMSVAFPIPVSWMGIKGRRGSMSNPGCSYKSWKWRKSLTISIQIMQDLEILKHGPVNNMNTN